MRRVFGSVVAIGLLVAGCGSGPSPEAAANSRPPSTTTTTEPPPQGVVYVIIENGRFAPSNLEIALEETWIVEWQHNDEPVTLQDGTVQAREYQIISRDRDDNGDFLFESPVMQFGDTFQFDFSTVEPDLYRYNTFLGMQRIPGLVDTRPQR